MLSNSCCRESNKIVNAPAEQHALKMEGVMEPEGPKFKRSNPHSPDSLLSRLLLCHPLLSALILLDFTLLKYGL
ncbi:hypothetical protein BDW67DRAFT_153044 [Aspergillus spinulosporus]